MEKDLAYVLADEQTLMALCDRLAKEITEDHRDSGRELVFVVILKGAVFFAADLIRRVPLRSQTEFMRVSSYGSGTESSGEIRLHLDLGRDVSGADVILIEDIIDSGRTLSYLVDYLKLKGAGSVRCATMLDKPSRRQVEFTPDYVGCEIPDVFAVGYGLDYGEEYRALPFVGVLKPEIYKS